MVPQVYLIVSEITLWLFADAALSMLLPTGLAVLIHLLLIRLRFGSSTFSIKAKFKLRHLLRFWPHIFLLSNALSNGIRLLDSIARYPSETIFVPFKEEIVYRLVLPRTILSLFPKISCLNCRVAVLVSTVLFCFAHRNAFVNPLLDMPVCFISGLALGSRSKGNFWSVLETTGIHALHNIHVIGGVSPGSEPSVYSYISPIAFYGSMLFTDVWLKG